MQGYGWEEYDIRTGGRQIVHDQGSMLDMVTEFVKIPSGGKGGSWGARITGKLREDAHPDLKSTVIFYAALEGLGMLEADASGYDQLGYAEDVVIDGESQELGSFKLSVSRGSENAHPEHDHSSYQDRPLDRTMVAQVQVPERALWQAKRQYRSLRGTSSHRLTRFLYSTTVPAVQDIFRRVYSQVPGRSDVTSVSSIHYRFSSTSTRQHAVCPEGVRRALPSESTTYRVRICN